MPRVINLHSTFAMMWLV